MDFSVYFCSEYSHSFWVCYIYFYTHIIIYCLTMTSTYFHMTEPTGSSGFLPTVTFTGTGTFTSAMRTSQLTTIGIDGFYEADFVDGITTIDGGAFQNDSKVVVVTINKVTSIGASAFSGCTALRSITLDTAIDTTGGSVAANPNYKRYLLASIGNSAFYGCTSLRNLHIPDTVKTIPDYLCYGCTGLEVAVMGYGCASRDANDNYIVDASINQYAFAGCTKLSFFIIPETVGTVGNNAFYNDPSLSYVAILGKPTFGTNVFTGSTMNSSTAKYFYDICMNNTSYPTNTYNLTVPSGATTNPYNEYTFQASDGVTLTYTDVNNRFNGLSSTPDWVKVKIKGGITTIGQSAFVPTQIYAVNYSKIIGFSIPSSVTTLSYGTFEAYNGGTTGATCYMAAHYIPNSVTTTSPQGSGEYNSYTFNLSDSSNCDLSQTRQIVFQSGLNKILLGCGSFNFSSVRAVILYDLPPYDQNKPYVTGIPRKCFFGAKYLQFVNVFQKNAYSTFVDFYPNAFDSTFNANYVGSGIHYVYIPKQFQNINTHLFSNVTANILFTCYEKPYDGNGGGSGMGSNANDSSNCLLTSYLGTSSNTIIHLICNWYDTNGLLNGSQKIYDYNYHVLFHPSIKTITNRFSVATNIKSMAVHHASTNVVDLNSNAFKDCTNLTYVYLNKKVNNIGPNSFRNAKLNAYFDLIDAAPLNAIYHASFYSDDGYSMDLSSITIPSSVKYLGSYVFGCGINSGNKTIFKSLSFATDISFWGDVDDTISSATFTDTDTNSARYMAIPASFCQSCYLLNSISFFDTVDASGNNITTINGNGMLQYPDLNSPMPTRYNKQILTNKIKRIGKYAFYRCRWLQSVRVPDGVTDIGGGAFSDLYSCTYFYLPDSFTTFNTAGSGVEALSYMNIDNNYAGSTTYPNYQKACIRFPSAYLSGIRTTTLTSTSFGVSTSSIYKYYITIDVSSTYDASISSIGVLNRFMNNNVTYFYFNVILPNNVTTLLTGQTASTSSFGQLNISSVTLPTSLITIGKNSFDACIYLKNVFIPTTSNLSFIGPYAFQGCSALNSFFIPNSLRRINSNTFSGCTSLASITYGDNPGIRNIGEYAFYNATRALTSIFIPASVVNIGRYAFIGDGGTNILNTVTFGAGSRLKAIGGMAFGHGTPTNAATYLYNLVLPSTLRYMGGNDSNQNSQTFRNAFKSNHSANLVLPSSLTFIPYAAFYVDDVNSATDISNIYVPMSITATAGPRIHNGYRDNTRSVGGVGGYVFNLSKSGSLIYLPSQLSGVTATSGDSDGNAEANSFPNKTGNTRTRSYYKSVSVSYSYSTNHLTSLSLDGSVFSRNTDDPSNTTQIHADISTSVIVIGDGSNSITTADSGNAANLISVNIPSTVTTIRDYAFKGSSALVYVTFSENSHLTSIGASSFQDCSMIHDIRLPDTLTSIGSNAFIGCSNLTSISIPYNVPSLGSGAFYTNPNTSSTFTQIRSNLTGPTINSTFGNSVCWSSDGLTLAIGAAGFSNNTGIVQVYRLVGSSWTQIGNLLGSLPTAGSYFGNSVSLSSDGNTLAIGGPNYSNNKGTVQVFKYINSTWTIVGNGTDLSGQVGSYFGNSVSLSADGLTVAIGASGYSSFTGLAQVFKFTNSTWNILGNATDLSGLTSASFGYSVSLSTDGTTLAVGAPAYNNDTGYVQVFNYSASSWTLLGSKFDGKRAINNSPSLGGSKIGYSVSLSSNGTIHTLAAGAYTDPNGVLSTGVNKGYVEVYRYSSSSWTQLGSTLYGSQTYQLFGTSVSLSSDGNTLAVGSPQYNDSVGLVQVYKYSGSSWAQIGSDITGPANATLGNSVSLSSDGYAVACGGPSYINSTGIVQIYGCSVFKSVQMHQRLYNTISSSLSSYFTSPSSINFQIISALQLTNTLHPSYLTLSQINNLYIKQRQSQLAFCTKITVAASSGTTLTLSDVTTALAGTTGFVHIDISTNVTSIASGACLNNTRVYSVAISQTVTTIGINSFNGCTNLTYLSFHPDSVCTIIDANAFASNNIIDLTLPDSLTTIGSNAFQSSNTLTSVCIPKSVTSTTFGNGPFLGCPKLTSVILPTSLPLLTYGTGTYFSTSGSTPPGSITSYPTTSDIPHFKLSDFSLPSGIVQNVLDSAVTYIDHRAYAYYPDLTLYAVSSTYQQTITSGHASYQVNNIKMPIMPATFMMNGTSWQRFTLLPIYRSVPDLNVYTDVYGTVVATMNNVDDGYVLMPGYSLCVFTNLYDEENLPVYDVSLIQVSNNMDTSEIFGYIDNQYGKVPINVGAPLGINKASSILIMFNGKIVGKMFAG